MRKLWHSQKVVVVVGGLDIGEPDKYPVGNSHKQIEICPDDSLDLKLTGQCLHNSWSGNKQFMTRIRKQLEASGCLSCHPTRGIKSEERTVRAATCGL